MTTNFLPLEGGILVAQACKKAGRNAAVEAKADCFRNERRFIIDFGVNALKLNVFIGALERLKRQEVTNSFTI